MTLREQVSARLRTMSIEEGILLSSSALVDILDAIQPVLDQIERAADDHRSNATRYANERDDLRARLDLLTPNHGAIWPWKCQSCGATGRIVRQPDDTDAKAFWRRSVSHGVTRRTCKTANLMWVSKGAL